LVTKIERSNRSLLAMVNDILDISKIEAGQLTLDVQPFSLLSLVDDVAALMGGVAAGKALELIVDVDPLAPDALQGDRVRLTQILTNLVGNAIKFTDRGSVRLHVSATDRDAELPLLTFTVSDTGPGIDADTRSKLFSRFTQGDDSHTRRKGGTGLGLAIVKEFVTLMGGAVGVESTPGAGSSFWCRMRLKRAPEARTGGSHGDHHILVVDKDEAQLAALAGGLRRFGWSIETASSGVEALAVLRRAPGAAPRVDGMVIDHRALSDGSDLLGWAREPGLRSPRVRAVVMTTGMDPAELRQRPEAALADVLLAKPVTPSALYGALRGALSSSGEGRVDMASSQPSSQRLLGWRILVADDAQINRVIVARILSLEGAEVCSAKNGREAVEHVLSGGETLDAVLMDLQMPELDGIEATQQIRAKPELRALPIIALTAGALASEQQRALDASMTDFVTKPFNASALIACIIRHGANGRAQRGQRPAMEATPPAAATTDDLDG
jgi:CheY-like chemotaxis protein